MVARLEAVEPGVDIRLKKPHLESGEVHPVFSLPYQLTPDSPNPTTPNSGVFHFYTDNVSHSGVQIKPHETGLGCNVNAGTVFSGELKPGESLIVGNLRITSG